MPRPPPGPAGPHSRPSTVARSDTVNSTPSRAAARSTSRTQPGTKRSRSVMAADSESGAESLVSSAAPDSVTVRLQLRASASTSSVRYSGLPAAPSASRSNSPRACRRPAARPARSLAPSGRLSSCRRAAQFGGVPEGEQVFPLGYRPHHPDQQQGPVLGRPGQPFPQADAGLIGPLEVINDQNGRLGGAQFIDQREQLLGQAAGHPRPGRSRVRREAGLRSFPGAGREWAPGSAGHPGKATAVTSAPVHHRRPRTSGNPTESLPRRRPGQGLTYRFLAHPRSAQPGPGLRRPRARSA